MKQTGGSKNYLKFPDEIQNADDMRRKFRFYSAIAHGLNLEQVFKIPEKTFVMFGQQSGETLAKAKLSEDDFTNFMFVDDTKPEITTAWYNNLYEQIKSKQFMKDRLYTDEDPYEHTKVSIYYPGDIVQNVSLTISDNNKVVWPVGIWQLPIKPGLAPGLANYNIKNHFKTYINEFLEAAKDTYRKQPKHDEFYKKCEDHEQNIVYNIPLKKSTLRDVIEIAKRNAKEIKITSEYTFIFVGSCRGSEEGDSNIRLDIAHLREKNESVETNLSYWLKLKNEIAIINQQRALSVIGRNLPNINKINIDYLKSKLPLRPEIQMLDRGMFLSLVDFKRIITEVTENKLNYFDVDPKNLYDYIGQRKLFEPGQIIQFSPKEKTELKSIQTVSELQTTIDDFKQRGNAETTYTNFITKYTTNKQSYTTSFTTKSIFNPVALANTNPYDTYMINHYKKHFVNVPPQPGARFELGRRLAGPRLGTYKIDDGSAITSNDYLWKSSNTYKNMIFGVVLSLYKINGELCYKVLCFYNNAAQWTSSICMIEPFHLFPVNVTLEQSNNLCNFINQNFNTSINDLIEGENEIINDYLTILRPFNLK